MLTLDRLPSATRSRRQSPWWRRAAAALAAAILLVTGTPAAAQPTNAYGYQLVPTRWGMTELGYVIQLYRTDHPEVTGRSNVAAFKVVLPDGKVLYVAAASVTTTPGKTDGQVNVYSDLRGKPTRVTVPGMANKHAEEVVEAYLKQQQLATGQTQAEQVTEGESELKPCTQTGHVCRFRLKEPVGNKPGAKPGMFPNIKVMRYAIEYDEPGVDNQKAVASLNRTVNRWVRAGRPLDALFGADLMSPPGVAPPAGGLADALAGVPGAPNGGIDFSNLELRYIADAPPGGDQGVRFAFSAPASNQPPRLDLGRTVTMAASDAFFVWLALSPSQFWVNLNPDEPDRIIDAKLGTTDAGRVLLQADLQMKKTTAKLIHPDTPQGKQFWDALDSGGANETCLSFRTWIVPAPATVREDQGALYILNAPLKVQLESEYLAKNAGQQYSCPAQGQATQARNEQLFRSTILPKIEDAVNHAPEYAELRRIYLSRVAAEWYHKRNLVQRTMFARLISTGDVSSWPARTPWQPKDIFDQYVKSYTKGEFNVSHTTTQGNQIITHTYTYGGVDFGQVPYGNMTTTDFTAKYGALPGTVAQSLQKPSADQNGLMWYGTQDDPVPQHPADQPVDAQGLRRAAATLGIGLLVCLLVVVAVVALVLFLVLRRRGSYARSR